MEVTASKSELSVSEGQVAFERGGQVIPVGAGQAAEATDRGVTLVASSAGPTNGEGRVIRELNIFPVAGAVSYGAGVAYDGKVLWVQTRYTNTLFKVEPKTLAPLGMQDVDVPGKKAWYGLAWDGESLWTIGTEGSKGKIHAVNPATGQLVKTLDGPGGVGLCGVAVGEGCLWLLGCGLGADQKVAWQVLKMDPSNGAVLGSWPVPAEIECWRNGLEYDHGALWIPGRITTNARGEQENELWKLNAADGSVLGRFTVRTTAVDMIEDLAMGDKDGEVWMIGQFRAYLVEFGSQSK
jgi:outer membrane protein assembly factor BamB